MRTQTHALCVLLLGALVAPLCLAGGPQMEVVKVDYAGFGYDTAVDTNGDGYFVTMTDATGKGSFGKSTIAITVEFDGSERLDYDNPACSEGPFGPYAFMPVIETVAEQPHYWAFVTTAADQSQAFGFFDQGFLCINFDNPPFDWFGMTWGAYMGGTGRYAGATGSWVSEYSGFNLDATNGLRSIRGTVEGELIVP